TLTVFENYPIDPDALTIADGVRVTGFNGIDATHYPLSFAAMVKPEGLALRLGYASEHFDAQDITAIGARVLRVLESLLADPTLPLGQLDVLSGDERHRMLQEWNATGLPVGTRTFVELFEERVATAPLAPAVVF
ncbi:hypothetical protein ADK60_25310, partial [Streptomyces sp. XY431]|uniref:condensation domain-containing protein n=1 Tax=Streptomyces sp. XY431 TaxID=1415562 RepID=UPI0006C12A80